MKETIRMESGLCLIIDLPSKKGGFGKKTKTQHPPIPSKSQQNINGSDKETLVYVCFLKSYVYRAYKLTLSLT